MLGVTDFSESVAALLSRGEGAYEQTNEVAVEDPSIRNQKTVQLGLWN